jgi:hypothetical protein
MKDDDDGNFTMREFCAWGKVGHTKAYEEIGTGRLRAIKVGNKTIVTKPDARAWRASFPAIKPRTAA